MRFFRNIQFKILLFFALTFVVILLFNQRINKTPLLELKDEETRLQLVNILSNFNQLTTRVEQNARALALVGQRYFKDKERYDKSEVNIELKNILIDNFTIEEEANGGGLWFEPYVFDPDKEYYGPYTYRSGHNIIFTWDLSNDDYNYHGQHWYKAAIPENWNLNEKRSKAVYWSLPYVESIGSYTFMMTASAPMYADKRIIGLASVDLAVSTLDTLLNELRTQIQGETFIISPGTNQFISTSYDQQLAMKNIQQEPWTKALVLTQETNQIMRTLKSSDNNEQIYYVKTDIGLIFGIITSDEGMLSDVESMLSENFWASLSLMLLAFILLWFFVRRFLSPITEIQELINESVTRTTEEHLTLKNIEYSRQNEFSPIIDCINNNYEAIREYLIELKAQDSQLVEHDTQVSNRLKARDQDVERLMETVSNMRNQLIQAEKAATQGTVVNAVAHELETAVNISLNGTTSLLSELTKLDNNYSGQKMTRGQLEHFLKVCKESARLLDFNLHRAIDLVGSFQAISIDQFSDNKRIFRLNDYIREVWQAIQPQFMDYKIDLNIEGPEDLEMDSYPGQFSQVLSNLMINSFKHGFNPHEKGYIAIKTEIRSQDVIIRYSDNGCGIAKEEMKHVFDEFYTTKKGQGCTGLGLYIVQSTIRETFGGMITIASKVGQYTEFTIVLPREHEDTSIYLAQTTDSE